MSNPKVKTATEIQGFIDWEFNIDIAAYQNSELRLLAEKLNSFLALDVETEDLDVVGETGGEGEDFFVEEDTFEEGDLEQTEEAAEETKH